ncbi:NADP-dependent oxidoreductase [Photobacterium sp. DNB22_13_2]
MKALQLNESNEISLQDIAIPSIADDEVLVKVAGAGINPVDWKIANGTLAFLIKKPHPLTLGTDLSGTITHVGSSVKQFNVGDRVYAMAEIGFDGTFAEYCRVNISALSLAPKSEYLAQAAAYPLTSLTAWQSLFSIGQLQADQRILIHAGAGGVGHIAVQLAKAKGAYVIATASAHNESYLYELGADVVLDYNNQDIITTLQTNPVDMVFDTLGGQVQIDSLKVIRNGGRLVSITGLSEETEALATQKNINALFHFVQNNGEQLTHIAELIDSGKLKANIQQSFNIESHKAAFSLSEDGHVRGKLIFTL